MNAAGPSSNAASPSRDCSDCSSDGGSPASAPATSLGGIFEGVPAGGPTEPLQLIDEGAPTPAAAQQSMDDQMADLTYKVLVLGLGAPSSWQSLVNLCAHE